MCDCGRLYGLLRGCYRAGGRGREEGADGPGGGFQEFHFGFLGDGRMVRGGGGGGVLWVDVVGMGGRRRRMARWWVGDGGVILCHSVVTCLAEILCYRRHFAGRALNFTHFWCGDGRERISRG